MKVQTQNGSYEITIMHGALSRADEFFNLDRKVLIVTDYDVPAVYAKTVAARCKQPFITAIPSGERSKSLENYKMLLTKMVEKGFTRSDCVVAVGGGVVGDLAGFGFRQFYERRGFLQCSHHCAVSGRFIGRRKNCNRFLRAQKHCGCVLAAKRRAYRSRYFKDTFPPSDIQRPCRGGKNGRNLRRRAFLAF